MASLSTHWGIAADASGNVYVADTNNNRIQKFTETGVFVAVLGGAGSGDGEFNRPEGVAVRRLWQPVRRRHGK